MERWEYCIIVFDYFSVLIKNLLGELLIPKIPIKWTGMKELLPN